MAVFVVKAQAAQLAYGHKASSIPDFGVCVARMSFFLESETLYAP